jgi:hypothetical protein
MSDEQAQAPISLWESAQAAIGAEAGNLLAEEQVQRYAKVATVAVMRQLDDEIGLADDDGVVWPDPGDLSILADSLEESP